MAAPKPYADFDAFWEARQATTTREQVKIRSIVVDVPIDVPLHLQLRAESADLMDDDEVRSLVGEFFGTSTLDAWVTDGMGARELAVVIAWATLRAGGQDVDFDAAADAVDEAMAGKAPTPPNRAARRTAAKTTKATPTRSSRTGASSSRTSGANTTSRKSN